MYSMPSDRVQKKITNFVEIFRGKMQENCVDYAENTPDYVEISTAKKIIIKPFQYTKQQ